MHRRVCGRLYCRRLHRVVESIRAFARSSSPICGPTSTSPQKDMDDLNRWTWAQSARAQAARSEMARRETAGRSRPRRLRTRAARTTGTMARPRARVRAPRSLKATATTARSMGKWDETVARKRPMMPKSKGTWVLWTSLLFSQLRRRRVLVL